MALIELENVSIEYPIYGYRNDSLKTTMMSGVLRLLGNNNNNLIGETLNVKALKKISLKATNGDRIGLIGPNGSGKTTLLYVLNQTLAPTNGKVKVEGRITSMLNLSCGVDPNLSGFENIKFRLKILKVPVTAHPEIIDDIVEASGLSKFIYLPIRTYSSGMSARLLFCMATAVKSDILLMDEWLSVGDEDFQVSAQQRLNNYIEKSSILVIATHNKELVQNLCNKVLVLKEGECIETKEYS